MVAFAVVLPIAPRVAVRPLLPLLPLPLAAALGRHAGHLTPHGMALREVSDLAAILFLLLVVILAPGVSRASCGQESGIPAPCMARPAHPGARGDRGRGNRCVPAPHASRPDDVRYGSREHTQRRTMNDKRSHVPSPLAGIPTGPPAVRPRGCGYVFWRAPSQNA